MATNAVTAQGSSKTASEGDYLPDQFQKAVRELHVMNQQNEISGLKGQLQMASQMSMNQQNEISGLKGQLQTASQMSRNEITRLNGQLQNERQMSMGLWSKNAMLKGKLLKAAGELQGLWSENVHLRNTLKRAVGKVMNLEKEKTSLNEELQKVHSNQIHKLKDYIIQREAVVYRKEDKLGEGAFGAVYKGNFYGATVAVKVLKDPSREKCTEFEREMKIAASLHHPNVVQVYGAIMEGNVAIVMEYLDLTLEDFIKQSDKNRRDKHFKSHALGVAKGLLYLHSKTPPVMHRDLHLGNVLLKKVGDDEYEVKIGDLGSANTLSKRIMTPDRGTPAYAAPENKTRDQQTPKMDVYSYGVLMYFLCTGQDQETSISYVTCPEKKKLILECTQTDPAKRPNMKHIIDFLMKNF